MRHASFLAIFLIGAGSAHAGDDLYKQCKVYGPESGSDRRIECPEGKVSVSRENPAAGGVALLDLMKKGLKGDLKALRVEDTEVVLAGNKHRAFRYALSSDGKLSGVVTVLPAPAPSRSQVRAVGCESRDPAWCARVFEASTKSLPAPNTSSATAEEARMLAGRKVEIPPSCFEKAPGQIECKKHSLTFMNVKPGEPSKVEDISDALEKGLANLGEVTKVDQPCKVEGSDASCRIFALQRADAAVVHVAFAFADVRGKRVFVQCNSSEGIVPMPQACGAVISIPEK